MDPQKNAGGDVVFAPNAGYTLIAMAFLIKFASWMVSMVTDGAAEADGSMPTLHFHGSGPDETAIVAEAKRTGVDVSHFPAIDHANDALREYPVFVNPSTSDVLCTATAEAVAMGKMVLIIEVGPLDAEL